MQSLITNYRNVKSALFHIIANVQKCIKPENMLNVLCCLFPIM